MKNLENTEGGIKSDTNSLKKEASANKAWSDMAAKAQPAKPTLAATSSMQTVLRDKKIKINKYDPFKFSF